MLTWSSLSLWTWQMAREFNLSCPIVDLRYVFSRRSALKDLSASADEAGHRISSLTTDMTFGSISLVT